MSPVGLTAAENTVDFASRYRAVNATFRRPLHFKLTDRGHYSEVNCLIASMVYGLMTSRRLIVTDSDFEGLRWEELYRSKLPDAPDVDIQSVEPDWRELSDHTERFWSLRRRVGRRHSRHIPVWNRRLGIFGDVLTVSRLLADAFCQPTIERGLGTSGEPYASFHIRRGDKVRGRVVEGMTHRPESEVIPVERYLEMLQRTAPGVRIVYVLTDDYSAVDELQASAPTLQFHTISNASHRGYDQRTFSAFPVDAKRTERLELIAETEIAMRSVVFIGMFGSNVSRFIALRHLTPDRCFSVDSTRRWEPA